MTEHDPQRCVWCADGEPHPEPWTPPGGWATGGYLPGYEGTMVIVREVAPCPDGHPLYVFSDDPRPQHIFTAAEVRARDLTNYECQLQMDGTR